MYVNNLLKAVTHYGQQLNSTETKSQSLK